MDIDLTDPTGLTARTCDRCPAEAVAEPVRLTLGARAVALDLCAGHAAELAELAGPWLAAAGGRRRGATVSAFPRLLPGEDRETIRTWALDRGLPVARSGTISAAVLAGYRSRELLEARP